MEHTVQGLEMGTVLVNSWFAIALSGVMLLQSYMYFRARPQQDNSIFGILVIALIILDLAHVACIMATLYHYLIRSFGQNKELEVLVPSLALTVGLTGTITFLAQSFFTWRVWKLSQNVIIVTVVLVLQVARLASGWATTAEAVKYGTFVAWTHKVRWVFTIGLILSVICDIILTSSLCYWLRESRTGVHGMDEKIDKIILYSIENGVLTCAISLITLICAIVMPKNLVFAGLHFIISKLYINSVLASLNTRNTFRARKDRLFLHARPSVPTSHESRSWENGNDYSLQSSKHLENRERKQSHSLDSISSVKETENVKSAQSTNFVVRIEDLA